MKRALLCLLIASAAFCPHSQALTIVTETTTNKAPDKAKGQQKDGSDEDNTPPPKLSPEAQARLDKFVAALKEKRTKHVEQQMKQEIDRIATLTNLDDNGKKALQDPADKSAAESNDQWIKKVTRLFAQQMANSNSNPNMFGALMAQVSMLVQQDNLWGTGTVTAATETDTWKNGVHAALNPQQLALWQKDQDDRKAATENQIETVMKGMSDRVHDQQKQNMLAACTAIEQSLNLPKDRAAQLEELAKSVVEKSTDLYRKQYHDQLSKMSSQTRKQIITQGNWYLQPDPDNLPDRQPEWKLGLAKILTPDETAKLAHSKDDFKNRRIKAAAQVMLALLDEKISLTGSQREKLTPIAEKLVLGLNDLFPQDTENSGDAETFNVNIAKNAVYIAASSANEADLKPILDSKQLEQWKKLKDVNNNSYGNQFTGDIVETGAGIDKPQPKKTEPPIDVETAIAQFLSDRATKERERALSDYSVKLDDLTRAVNLSAEVAADLHVAAEGMAERQLTAWRWSNEQQVRAQIQDATPENIHERLKSIGMIGYQDFNMMSWGMRRRGGEAPPKDIWESAIDADLTPQQKEVWQKEVKDRADYRSQAIASFVTVQFEGRYHLSPEQSAKLQPAITKIVVDYAGDMQRFYSDSNPVPWYLQGFWCFMPISGIPDDQLKAVLTQQQLDAWNSSSEKNNGGNVWQSLQQMHNQNNN